MMHANTHGNCVLEGVWGVRGVRAHSAFNTDALARTHSCTQVVCPGNVDEFTIAKLGEPMPFTSAGCFENEFYVGFFCDVIRRRLQFAVCSVYVCVCVSYSNALSRCSAPMTLKSFPCFPRAIVFCSPAWVLYCHSNVICLAATRRTIA